MRHAVAIALFLPVAGVIAQNKAPSHTPPSKKGDAIAIYGCLRGSALEATDVGSGETVSPVTQDYVAGGRRHVLQDKTIPDYVAIFRIHGPFLFGSTDKLEAAIRQAGELPPIVVLRLRNMTAIDATGMKAIQDVADSLRATGRTLLLCGALPQPAALMKSAEFHRHLGPDNILPDVDAAIARASELWLASSSRLPRGA